MDGMNIGSSGLWWVVAGAVAVGLLLLLGRAGSSNPHAGISNPRTGSGGAGRSEQTTKPEPSRRRSPLKPDQIYERNKNSVVAVRTDRGQGSGFVLSRQGLVATNAHVIDGARRVGVEIHPREKLYAAEVVATDAAHDLALLRVGAPRPLDPVELGRSKSVSPGDEVFAIGNPRNLNLTLSDGLVSAFRQTGEYGKAIQISAPISSGSSGGALFNVYGEVVGVTTSSVSEGQNLNFAVPVARLRSFARRNGSKLTRKDGAR